MRSILSKEEKNSEFPVPHLSYSSMRALSTNPILFKIKYLNRDTIDTASNISGVLGNAFHNAMNVYYGGSDVLVPVNEAEAIEYGLKAGMEFLSNYNDGFINFSKTIENKQKALELFSFCFQEYIKKYPYKKESVISTEDKIIEKVEVEWRGKILNLPIKLKGYIDLVERDEKGRIIITDYKTCYNFSDPEKIDGAKILQAVENFLLVYAKYGEEPYSIKYKEVKYTKNRDGGSQVREYELVFKENDLFFDFYFRFYEDVVRALNGEMVYLPNVDAIFDNEVAIVSYIHRLDVSEETAKLMKKHNVENISDLLKKEIQSAGNMRKLLKQVEEKFVSAKNINYDKMSMEQKIQTKMLEFGIMLQFDSKIEGATVDLYRYTPSIGVKMAKLRNYVDDIEQITGVADIRVLAPIRGTKLVGFEIPKPNRTFPDLPKVSGFNIAIGVDIMGKDRVFDIRQAPHLLIAGSTGSGKSVLISNIVRQLRELKKTEIHLYDPKIVELKLHINDHNVKEYKSDVIEIQKSLAGMLSEMDKRYKVLSNAGVRNIEDYSSKMNYKFLIVDEFADLSAQTKDGLVEWKFCEHHLKLDSDTRGEITEIMYTKKSLRKREIEIKEEVQNCEECKKHIYPSVSESILRIAQKGRACGIHLVVSTQRPSVDIITGTIKANFPTKIALRTARAIDSNVIIDIDGAEKLKGKGDMLFSSIDGVERLQGYKD